MNSSRAAAVIGAGPNGLAAAVTLARAGVPVTVYEAAETIGGGTRTMEIVEPGVVHDVCSAIHPMALATEFFQRFEITRRMEFAVPEASYANPLAPSRGDARQPAAHPPAALAYRNLERTAHELGRDGAAYASFYRPLLRRLEGVIDFTLGGGMLRVPGDPVAAILTALRAGEQGTPFWNLRFREEAAPALITGAAAHSFGAMPSLATAGVGTVLGALGHAAGWPVPIGGSRAISDALAADLLVHGGRIETGRAIEDMRELEGNAVTLFDTSARGLLQIAGSRLPAKYRRALSRFRYGSGATKVDFVLDGPIPWADPRVIAAPTVHLGGSRAETAAAERAVTKGEHPDRPYVLLAQPGDWDPARNPAGVNAVWSYTHVPSGSNRDVSERVIAQIERFAPGFRDRIRAFHVTTAADYAGYNRNYHGGDLSAGAVSLRQLLARPVFARDPWRTPAQGIYLCSSSTSPGPGVHGLSGWHAARSALRHEYGLPAPDLSL